jgi:hypothetical protein
VALLHVSERTATKIISKHGIHEQEVRDAVEHVAGLGFVLDEDEERGLRALVRTEIRSRDVLIVLYPKRSVMGDEWHLGSAYFV